ncbi:MAG: tetratricopeptide repeat protein [Enhygromyxa sp.]
MDTTTMMRRRNLRVTEQLLGELEAGRYDSALTRRILAAPSAFPRLLRACFLAQDRKLAAARRDVEEALEHGGQNPVVQLVAGMISFATRDYQRALDRLEQVASTTGGGAAARARRQIVAIAGGLGWEHDVRRAIEAAIEAEPEEPSWHAQAVRLFARGRRWDRALEHARRALALAPGSARMWMEAAGLHARLDQRDAARDALQRALELAPAADELIYRREGARVAIDAGHFELAIACLVRALELEPAADLHVQLAELHSWAGDDQAAKAASERALALDPEFGPALRMRGALEVRAGRHEQAIELLKRAIERDFVDYQAHLWLSEAYLRLDRFAEAHAQLHHGTMNADGFLFVAWLLRFLIVAAEQRDPDEILTPNRTEEFDAALRELCPELAPQALASMRTADLCAAVEAGLAALRGNRSVYATHVVDGRLTRLHARTGCRHQSRWALQLLRVASGDECLARFAEIVARYPGSSLPLCHRGELHLWLGNFEAARADLEAAIASVEGTRWAYMGLSTLALVRGDPQACLEINARGVEVMQGTEGPAIHVYRGEAKRLLGRDAEAIAELEQALEWHPARASATINLALSYQRAGERSGFERLWLRLRDEQAPGLLSDAAHELGLTIIGDDDWQPDDAVKLAVLERSLAMMGGNRSSGLITYWTGDGKLRFVPLWPSEGAGPHARDHEHLEQAKRVLLKALAHYKGPRPP